MARPRTNRLIAHNVRLTPEEHEAIENAYKAFLIKRPANLGTITLAAFMRLIMLSQCEQINREHAVLTQVDENAH